MFDKQGYYIESFFFWAEEMGLLIRGLKLESQSLTSIGKINLPVLHGRRTTGQTSKLPVVPA